MGHIHGLSKTAGIIIIGDEILSGKVMDVNSHYLAAELRTLGVEVKRISVIPDSIEVIGREVYEFSRSYDHVITTGGVGPTHDDVTMKGIAGGFGVRLVEHPGLLDELSTKYSNPLNKWVLKMAEVPEGAGIIADESTRFPVIVFKNVFVFPGIPEYLRNKFPLIRDRLSSEPFFTKRIYLSAHEAEIAEILNSALTGNSNVCIGSYPVIDNPEYSVVITVDSKSKEDLNRVFGILTERLPKEMVVKID